MVLLAASVVTKKIASNQAASSANETVAEELAALNAQAPQDVAPGVTFTKAELIDKTVRITYAAAPSVPFDAASRSLHEANVVTQVCGAMAEMGKRGFTVEYRYEYTEAGAPKTFDVSVPPSKCA